MTDGWRQRLPESRMCSSARPWRCPDCRAGPSQASHSASSAGGTCSVICLHRSHTSTSAFLTVTGIRDEAGRVVVLGRCCPAISLLWIIYSLDRACMSMALPPRVICTTIADTCVYVCIYIHTHLVCRTVQNSLPHSSWAALDLTPAMVDSVRLGPGQWFDP